MDNLFYSINDVHIDLPTTKSTLIDMGVAVTHRTVPKLDDDQITFSLPVGHHGSRWMFRYSVKRRLLSCSGGVTKTFFGHNLWVFKNEAVQLASILDIVNSDLAKINGFKLPSDPAITIKRVEVTRHHQLDINVSKANAIERLAPMFTAKYGERAFHNGATIGAPGTIGIGKVKSDRVCRVYDPAFKFVEKPKDVSDEAWSALCAECVNHLRVELIFGERELHSAGLSTKASWADQALINDLIVHRYGDYGLSAYFTPETLREEDVRATNPAYVEAARYFFTDGAKGEKISSRSGSSGRFKKYMAEKGYCVDVPFKHHRLMAHGLHEILQPLRAAELPEHLRCDVELFGRWWLV